MTDSVRAMFVLLCSIAALGCSLPTLDTTGVIRCGDRALCPGGFMCVQGRCCPQGAPLATCPLGLDAAGADTTPDAPANLWIDARPDATIDVTIDSATDVALARCAADPGASTCAPGQECRHGYCCDFMAGAECPPGGIGAPCTMASDCSLVRGDTVLCQRQFDSSPEEELPRGYCTTTCNPSAPGNPCGPQSVCVDFFLGFGACVARCAPERQCRREGPGYICLTIDIGMNRTAPICVPDCAQGTHCATGNSCYSAGHLCLHDCNTDCPFLTACSRNDGVCLRSCILGQCQSNYACDFALGLCRAI